MQSISLDLALMMSVVESLMPVEYYLRIGGLRFQGGGLYCYAESVQDEEEDTKNRSLWDAKQDVVRFGSLGAIAHFTRATRKESIYPM